MSATRREKTILTVLAIPTVIAALLLADPAEASGAPSYDDVVAHDAALFCQWLDADHSPAGVMRAINEFNIQQVDETIVGDIANRSMTVVCPEYADDVVNAYWHYEVTHADAPVVKR